MDKREQKTRQAVFDAVASLLKEKDFESISVTDILKRSNISRSTFYAHFAKKEDVIKDLCDELFHHVLSPDLKKEHGHDFSTSSIFDYLHLLTHFLFHIQEDQELIYGISTSSASPMFHEALKEKLLPLMEACIKSHTLYKEGIDPSFQSKIFTELFIDILDEWIVGGCTQAPTEIADIFHRFATDRPLQ